MVCMEETTPDWVLQILKLVISLIETEGPVSWKAQNNAGWEAELYPGLVETPEDGNTCFDDLSVDVFELLGVFDDVPYIECSADGVAILGDFAGNEIYISIYFYPPENAEIVGV